MAWDSRKPTWLGNISLVDWLVLEGRKVYGAETQTLREDLSRELVSVLTPKHL